MVPHGTPWSRDPLPSSPVMVGPRQVACSVAKKGKTNSDLVIISLAQPKLLTNHAIYLKFNKMDILIHTIFYPYFPSKNIFSFQLLTRNLLLSKRRCRSLWRQWMQNSDLRTLGHTSSLPSSLPPSPNSPLPQSLNPTIDYSSLLFSLLSNYIDIGGLLVQP